MKTAVVTTFSAKGWDQYAHRMVETFERNWPGQVDLFCYADTINDAMVSNRSGNVIFRRHDGEELAAFKARHTDPIYHGMRDGTYNYRFDVVKFAHKPFAIWHFMRTNDMGYTHVIWLDADTLTHQPVPLSVVRERMCIKGADFVYLGRDYKYSECGFMVFDARRALGFINRVVRYYTKRGFRAEKEWHDSYLFDQARTILEAKGDLRAHNLTPHLRKKTGGGHPFVNSFLGEYMDHLKGDSRKRTGRPRPQDNVQGHTAPYWRR